MQEERWGDHIDTTFAFHFGVRNTLAIIFPHRILPPLSRWFAESPKGFTRRRIDRHNRTTLTRYTVEPAIDIDRCGAEDVIRRRAEVITLPDPSHFKIFEIVRVNLC